MSTHLHIVFHHEHPLPVTGYGGIERILYWHMKSLVKQGHLVTLIGHKDSDVQKDGINLIPLSGDNWEKLIPPSGDILHLQYNHLPTHSDIPTLNTIHGNGKIGEVFKHNTVFVSKDHAENHNAREFIHNALDFDEYPMLRGDNTNSNWSNFAFLAKASWKVKNLKGCIEAVKKGKKHLHILGGKSLQFWAPITNYGFVNNDQKLNALKKCDALLWPVRWHEPFGIALLEALSQGLPLIISNYGGPKEILSEGLGLQLSTQKQFNEVIAGERPCQILSSMEIRKKVQERFSIETYSYKYVEIYQRVIKGETLHKNAPTWKHPYNANEIRPF